MKKENGVPDFVKLEKDILKFWEQNKCFEKLKAQNEGHKMFRFLDGPITANNRMGVHHIWGRALKDITLKYNALKGKDCMYQNGFDAQGMWVEVNVEKELGLNGKPEIINYGIDKFTEKCIERVQFFASEITGQSKRMGQWMDWNNSYYTNSDNNILSIWAFLKKCSEKNWLIRKNRPMWWCPRCGTSLSEHEMAGSYHDITHTALYVKFPVTGKDFSVLAWTTTPWTLTANAALAVNPEETYVKVEIKEGWHPKGDGVCDGEKLVLIKSALKIIKQPYTVLEEFKGSALVGLIYETCFPKLDMQKFEHKILPWKEVSAEEGCGVVHIAPGCGAGDFELGQEYNLPQICPIDEQGIMIEGTGCLAGKKTTDVANDIIACLKAQNKLFLSHPIKHSYPYCWRCKTDLVTKLVNTWYISIEELRPKLLKAIDDVVFEPPFVKKRMLDWLNNMGDWNISRARFYGLPLPFYLCKKCGHIHVIGGLTELKKLAANPKEIDKMPNIHRPYIDKIKIKCEKCGAETERISEVGDCWLDAGIVPFSTKKYFTDKNFFNKNFPNEYVCEMVEQIRLWFYSMLVMSVVLTGKAPYQKIVTHQAVKDEKGEEFHKSGGNSLDCDIVADKVGADAMRYLYGGANITNELRFGYNLLDEARRKIMGLWNIYTFFNTYASIDNPDIAHFKPAEFNISDKWLIEKINKFVADADGFYKEHKSYLVVKDFEVLIDDISNFYIRANRKRFWKSENAVDQLTAYWCLYFAIKNIVGVMAPVIPFVTEYIWGNTVRCIEPESSISVMLAGFPAGFKGLKFDGVVESSQTVRAILTVAQKLRNENQLKIKQPLKAMYIICEAAEREAVKAYEEIILEELNIKEIIFEKDNSKFNIPYLGVNFKEAGQVLKGDVQKLKTYLAEADDKQMAALIKEYKGESIVLQKVPVVLDGKKLDLAPKVFTLNFKPKKDFVIDIINNITVVLDITIDRNLMLEGLFRELIRATQVLRKEAGFAIEAYIDMDIICGGDIAEIVEKFKGKLIEDVLVNNLNKGIKKPDIEKQIEIEDEKVIIKMKGEKSPPPGPLPGGGRVCGGGAPRPPC